MSRDLLWPDANALTRLERISPHQREKLACALGGRLGLLLGTPGTGKAQPMDALVMTLTGPRPMGELRFGDFVLGSNGHPTPVLGVFPQGEKAVYRVIFSDGASVECCGEHLWLTQTRCSRKNAQRNKWPLFRAGRVRSTEEIASTLLSTDGHFNHYIPLLTSAAQFAWTGEVPIPAYLMGLLLGDGCFRQGKVLFTSADDELVRSVSELIPKGCRMVRRANSTFDWSIRGNGKKGGNPLRELIVLLGLAGCDSGSKFIPPRFLLSTPQQRLELLQGLLDTDGTVDRRTGQIEYNTASPKMAEGICFIVESLGGICNQSWRPTSYVYEGERRQGRGDFRLRIKLPPRFTPFRIARKSRLFRPLSKYLPGRAIVDIQYVGRKECQCIAVAASDRLYLTDHFVVTHNTFTTGALIQYLASEFGQQSIAVCAPTGKAAVRVTEAMRKSGVGLRATTIHQLLEIGRNGHDGDGWDFQRNADNPIEQRFLLIDESSMVDTDLAAALFSAIGPRTHVLFVGDPYQLPPVGHGAPLRDMIAAGVPQGELSEIQRNAGLIVKACAAIKAGGEFETCTRYDPGAGRNLRHIEIEKPEQQLEALLVLLNKIAESDHGWHPKWDVQVIIATNESGPLARKMVNRVLQIQLNPDGAACGEHHFRVGDKVVCLRNHWAPDDLGGDAVYVANGEIGEVKDISQPGKLVLTFQNPQRRVLVASGKKKTDGDGEGSGDLDSGSGVRGCDFDLAYAITCHKAQGSEWPVVIVLLDGSAGARRVCSREWLYTAVSRASQLCCTIGRITLAHLFARRPALDKRKTLLAELIRGNDSMKGASA